MRRTAALLVGLSAAAALAACGGGSSSSTERGATASSAAQSCTTGTLHLSLGKGSVATGHVATPVLIKSSSKRPCSLSGYPSVTLLGPGGQPLSVKVKPAGADFFGKVPDRIVAIPAGGEASFRLVTSNGGQDLSGCPKARSARIELPDNAGTQTLSFAAAACPGTITVSRIGSGRSAE
jgi:Domain of unknown function (DUF4232)